MKIEIPEKIKDGDSLGNELNLVDGAIVKSLRRRSCRIGTAFWRRHKMNRIKKINSEIYGMDISELLYPVVIPDDTKKKWSYKGIIENKK